MLMGMDLEAGKTGRWAHARSGTGLTTRCYVALNKFHLSKPWLLALWNEGSDLCLVNLKERKIEEIDREELGVRQSSEVLKALFTTWRQITLLLLRDKAASLIRQNLDNSGFIRWGQIKHAHGLTCVIEIFLFLRSVYFYLHFSDEEMLVSDKAGIWTRAVWPSNPYSIEVGNGLHVYSTWLLNPGLVASRECQVQQTD